MGSGKGVKVVYPTFVICDDIVKRIWVCCNVLEPFLTNFCLNLHLLLRQQMCDSRGAYLEHLQMLSQNSMSGGLRQVQFSCNLSDPQMPIFSHNCSNCIDHCFCSCSYWSISTGLQCRRLSAILSLFMPVIHYRLR